MAIEPSILAEESNFKLIPLHDTSLLQRDFLIETTHKLFETSVAQFLGLDEMVLQESAITCVIQGQCILGRYNCIKFITYEQMMDLLANTHNPRADKFKPLLSQAILTQVLPLFNQNSQIKATRPEMMSSLQIAKLTGKQHKDVMRDIRTMLEVLDIQTTAQNCAVLKTTYKNSQNKSQPMYELNEELTLTLTSGYSIPQRNAIIKEWQAYRYASRLILIDSESPPSQTETKPETQPALPAPHIVNASAIKIAVSTIDKLPIGEERKAILKAQLLSREFGLNEGLMLPDTPHMLSATEIANKIGLTANAIGRIVNELGIRDNQELCQTRAGIATHNNKQVEQYYYMPQVVEMIRKHLAQKGGKNGKTQQTNLL